MLTAEEEPSRRKRTRKRDRKSINNNTGKRATGRSHADPVEPVGSKKSGRDSKRALRGPVEVPDLPVRPFSTPPILSAHAGLFQPLVSGSAGLPNLTRSPEVDKGNKKSFCMITRPDGVSWQMRRWAVFGEERSGWLPPCLLFPA